MEIAQRAFVAAVCLVGGLIVGVIGMSLVHERPTMEPIASVQAGSRGVSRDRDPSAAANAIALRTLELTNARKRVIKLQSQLDAQTVALNAARRELRNLAEQNEKLLAERNVSLDWLITLLDDHQVSMPVQGSEEIETGEISPATDPQLLEQLLEIENLRSELELARAELAEANAARQLELLEADAAQEQVERVAAELLMKVGEEAVTALSEALEHPNANVRRLAAKTLQSFGQAGQSAIPALTMALADPDMRVREEAAIALRAISD